MAEDKKYYWLKLKKDFFKRHDIQIIESMDNGKDYILFYLKMLVESVDHEGNLRFNDTIPYNEKMLATITNTNIDIVRGAMKVFTGLSMMEVLADETIYMNEVQKMLGTETYWAEQKRKQRELESQKKIGQCPNNVQQLSNVSNQEIDKDIELDINKDIDNNIDKPQKEKITYMDLTFIDDVIEKVKITQDQYNKLLAKYNQSLLHGQIIALDNYIVNGKGNKYKDHYRALNTWCKDKGGSNGQFSKNTTTSKKYNIKREEFDASKYNTTEGDMPV